MILDSNKLKNLIPYLGTLFIVAGYLKLSIYYDHFNVKISDYLEITEILTLFLNDAFIYSGILLFLILINFLKNDENEDSKKELLRNEHLDSESILNRLKLFLKLNIYLVLILALYIIFLGISYFLNLINFHLIRNAVIFLSLTLVTNYLAIEFNRKYKITYGKELSGTYFNLIIITSQFMIYIFTSTLYDIRKTEINHHPIISFTYNQKVIKSSEKLLFLGVTKNYLFMFDKKNKISFIYSRQNINEFQIKK